VDPFITAWETRDLDAFADHLADDVVLHSPLISSPFEGKEAAVELYGVLFDRLGAVEITDQLVAGDSRAYFWRAESGGRWIDGSDLIRYDAEGRIREVTVSIRPLRSLAVFASAVGPALAAKRGRLKAVLARVLIAPLGPFFALADILSARLVLRR
jgi:hypothetical protein